MRGIRDVGRQEKRLIAVLLAAVAALTSVPFIPAAGAASGNSVPMSITVDGLEGNDEAFLRIGVDNGSLNLAGQALYEYTVKAASGAAEGVEINPTLEDGGYLLVVDAPEKYFREPRGYMFRVYQGAVLNPVGHSIEFKLIPPEARDYEIYRRPSPATVPNFSPVVPLPPTGEVKYRQEGVISLSAPTKQPIEVSIPPTTERIEQWWQVPQLRAAAVMILLIVGAAILVIVRTIRNLRARRQGE